MIIEKYDYTERIATGEEIAAQIIEADSLLEAAQMVQKERPKDTSYIYLWADAEENGFVDEILLRPAPTA